MFVNSRQLQDFAQERRKDMEREARNERLINSIRQAQREQRAEVVRETRSKSQRNSSPLWARFWSLL